MPLFKINDYLTLENDDVDFLNFISLRTMDFTFYKYHGTGNDFVLIDNRSEFFPKQDKELVAHLCHRRFGIGADGLILLENHSTQDFKMVYYNSDGNQSSMCGNGGRCIVHFAQFLGIIDTQTSFEAIDGAHTASIQEDGSISLKMTDVSEIRTENDFAFLDTGSPHHVTWVKDLKNLDVYTIGKEIRNNQYGAVGANVNFVKQTSADSFSVRTYERGVEDETLSCGTGVTAVALAMFESQKTKSNKISIETPGGKLQVRFKKTGGTYTDIYLEGPAKQVFKGSWK